MTHQEILKEVRRIEITSNRFVNDVFAGEYSSVFKGRGMEFDEVREYQPGDDIRTIDWNVTARMRRPFVKQYMEERELTVMLLVDASSSLEFGTRTQTKRTLVARVCALVAFSAIKNNDKVGLIIFTDHAEHYVPPKKGRKHVLRVIRDLLEFQPSHRATDLSAGLDYVNRVLRRRSVVFLISDFRSSGYETSLRLTNRRHDVIAVTVEDPAESALPPVGYLELEDAETGEPLLVDARRREVQELFPRRVGEQRDQHVHAFRAARTDAVALRTDEPYVEPLSRLFRERMKRMGR